MKDYRVEFVRRDYSSGALVLDVLPARFSEGSARSLAWTKARECKTGARVMLGASQITWFLWDPSRKVVIEMAPGAEWRESACREG